MKETNKLKFQPEQTIAFIKSLNKPHPTLSNQQNSLIAKDFMCYTNNYWL
jgi:hypothetical protein